jgi:hypothetical protein
MDCSPNAVSDFISIKGGKLYKPGDFKIETMHALKYLWVFDRRAELVHEKLDGLSFEEKLAAMPAAIRSATERVQIETGLSPDDLRQSFTIGTFIAEYREMLRMSEDELEDYLAVMDDSDPTVLLEDERLVGLVMDIAAEFRKGDVGNEFNEIIERNFLEGEE